jgi:hypothetical protein
MSASAGSAESHASHSAGVVSMTGMALAWIGRTASFGWVVRNPPGCNRLGLGASNGSSWMCLAQFLAVSYGAYPILNRGRRCRALALRIKPAINFVSVVDDSTTDPDGTDLHMAGEHCRGNANVGRRLL